MRLVIVLDVDVDPTLVDARDIAFEVLADDDGDGNLVQWPRIGSCSGLTVTFESAEWEDS